MAESEGRLRALAMTGSEKLESLPDVPTYEEAGYKPATLGTAWGIIAPPETPDDVGVRERGTKRRLPAP